MSGSTHVQTIIASPLELFRSWFWANRMHARLLFRREGRVWKREWLQP
jgi:hypothetical protein